MAYRLGQRTVLALSVVVAGASAPQIIVADSHKHHTRSFRISITICQATMYSGET